METFESKPENPTCTVATKRLRDLSASEWFESRDRRMQLFGGVVFLALAAFLLYSPSIGYNFVLLDDHEYVLENPLIAGGLNSNAIRAAFTQFNLGSYIPLTLLSFMLDVSIFGLNPAGFHLTNVLLFAATAALLFMAFERLTGRFWPSFLAVLLFVAHPLRVESVVWVTERKDMLSGLFFAAALLSYAGWARGGGRRYYFSSLALMFFGLLSKPSLVVLPALLLLLDWWPLLRLKTSGPHSVFASSTWKFSGVIGEKLPFFALAAVASLWTMSALKQGLVGSSVAGLWLKINLIASNYALYVSRTLWPARLFHEHAPTSVGLLPHHAWLHLLWLGGLTWVLWRHRRSYPCLLVGWLWFVAALFPVSGVVLQGAQVVSDRWTYLPQTGLFLTLSCAIWDASDRFPEWKRAVFSGIFVVAALLSVQTVKFSSYWKDGLTLSAELEKVYGKNTLLSRFNFGRTLGQAKDHVNSSLFFQSFLNDHPDDVDALFNLAVAYSELGKFQEARRSYLEVLRLAPGDLQARMNLALLFIKNGAPEDARPQLEFLLKRNPADHKARSLLDGLPARDR